MTNSGTATTAESTEQAPDPAPSARRGRLGSLLPMLVCDVGLPLSGYYILHALGVGDVVR